MAGLYIHIPFCKSRCIYCDFYSSTDQSLQKTFVQAVISEAKKRKAEFIYSLDTLYIGGGTPSFLDNELFIDLVEGLNEIFSFCSVIEFTVEVNPDDVSFEKLLLYKHLGVNRISIGVQSLDDGLLRFLSRRHNATQAMLAVEYCRKAGIDNISVDLLYGINGLTSEQWTQTIEEILSWNVPHISAYHLTVEEGTLLYKYTDSGNYSVIVEEESVRQYDVLCRLLKEAGYDHYEISNFARKGYFSRHNSSYWTGEYYLGLGPSAHSYYNNRRTWNVSSIAQYIDCLV